MQKVTIKSNLDNASPWASCLNQDISTRMIVVEGKDGVPSIEEKYSLAFQEEMDVLILFLLSKRDWQLPSLERLQKRHQR